MQRGGFILKCRCPKCGGSIYLDNDVYGWFEQCLQCGYTCDMAKIAEMLVNPGKANAARYTMIIR